MKLSDEVIVKRCLEGDGNAFSLLVGKYQNAVYGLCFHIVGNFADAQDLTQEAFVKAYLDLVKIRDPTRFASWLYRITVNVCKMWLRGRKGADDLPLEALAQAGNELANGRSPEQQAEVEELRLSVREAIASLSEKNRLAITLYYIDGLSYKEIGDFLSLPQSTIKGRLHKARKQLRKELISMVEDNFDRHKLPEDFPEKVVQEAVVKSVLVIKRGDDYDDNAAEVVLQNKADEKQLLPMVIDLCQGISMVQKLENRQTPRPMMHDLMADILRQFDMKVAKVVVTDLKEGSFYGKITIERDGVLRELDARVSDAIILALTTGAPIFVAKSVLSKGAVDKMPRHTGFITKSDVVEPPGGVPKDARTELRPIGKKLPTGKLVELKLDEHGRLAGKARYERVVLPLMFSIDPKFQSDLDSWNVSEELRQEFENNGVSLSQNVSIRGCVLATFLSSIGPEFQSDLDSSSMSEELRQEFEDMGISLSQNVKFVAQQEKGIWVIKDKGNDKSYLIKEIRDVLDVYFQEHKGEWRVNDESDDKEYLIAKEKDKLNVYSAPKPLKRK